jgi:hypothetical protein
LRYTVQRAPSYIVGAADHNTGVEYSNHLVLWSLASTMEIWVFPTGPSNSVETVWELQSLVLSVDIKYRRIMKVTLAYRETLEFRTVRKDPVCHI